MSGEDLFSVFSSESTSISTISSSSKDAEDKMASLEKAKELDIKMRSAALLQCLKEGITHKRPIDLVELDNDNEEKVDENESETKSKRIKDSDEVTPESLELETLEQLPRIKIHTVQTVEACLHEVAIPDGTEYEPLKITTNQPAKEFPFVLDPFQKEALLCLDNNQSVLVSAHTSAGKTVVALYAVAMSLRDKQRVIYTTPIKALSNQKYRELFEEFSDVGLMTGDVTINPSASCLVMTTEILRSMLYRGSEVMREVGWVIFDEIHYMRDKERGVVWEESIILCPDEVRYVFLSATIPNALQFAEWVVYLHHQPCHVVYTDYRPVPLQHFIYPAGGDGLHLVVNEKSEFREENFNKAMAVLSNTGESGQGDGRRGRKGGPVGDSNVFKIIKMIMEKQFSPVIVFSFSRKECEGFALDMAKLDFNDDKEKDLIQQVFNNAMDVLSDDDKNLPQIAQLLPILKRGIGIHHSGLLPILKETIEILFSEGLIKALFATETFSMGLNMPAKTVLFTGARKFDGKDYRWLSSGEYIQMSGRAGRRGLDERGMVILIMDQQMGSDVAKQVVKGLPDPLNSQFRLTYNMVLNLLRVEGINPEFMLERSFFQFQNYSALPSLYKKMADAEKKYGSIRIPKELEVTGYCRVKQEIAAYGRELQKIITKPIYLVPFLQPGRLIRVQSKTDDFGWGMVVNFDKKASKDPFNPEPVYKVDALLYVSKESVSNKSSVLSTPRPCPDGETGQMEVVPIVLSLITQISSVRIYFPEDLRPLNNRQSVYKTIQEVQKRFKDNGGTIPLLDPVEDMQIKDTALKEVVKKIETYEDRLVKNPLRKDPQLNKLCDLYEQKLATEQELKMAKEELKKAKSLLQLDELKCRKRVLRRLEYCNSQDVITLKGRVACEISAADELLLTEMLFSGAFNNLTPQQSVALLSCFVFQENAEMPKLADDMSGLLRQMQEMARHIAKVTVECKLPMEEDKYVESFKPHLMDVVHAWSSGSSFSQIIKMTSVFEGSIIRCMRRLEELLREMCGAAKAMGNADLENKFADGIRRIKRDIIFAASLYL